MEAPTGMTTTARRVQGPGLELVGLDGPQGAHTALVLPVGSPCRAEGVRWEDRARAFLERPGIAGLARLVGAAPDGTSAWYATGEVWSAAEVWASLRRKHRQPGLRAGVELAWRVADMLFQAERDAAGFGLRGHGALDPWRIALRRDGQVIVLGYGLSTGRPHQRCQGPELAEALRYAPPERLGALGARQEDASSDVFSLALVAMEWALGAPVYDAEGEALARQASEADGDRRLWAARERLPGDVVEVLGRALRRDPEARWPSLGAFKEEARRLVSHPAVVGPTLLELMQSSDVDRAPRFLGLAELRGAVAPVQASGRTVEAGPPLRWVSLGGRRATAERLAAEARQRELVATEEQAPLRASSNRPPPVDALSPSGRGVEAPAPVPAGDAAVAEIEAGGEPESATSSVTAPQPPSSAAPPATASRASPPAPVSAPSSPPPPPAFVAPTPAFLPPSESEDEALHATQVMPVVKRAAPPSPPAADMPVVVGEPEDAETLYEPRASADAATHPSHDAQELRASVRAGSWQVDEHPTTIEPFTGDLVRIRVLDADERASMHLVSVDLKAAEVVEVVVRERGLPRSDLLGATVFGWRLARGGAQLADDTPARELAGDSGLTLVRIGNRPVLCHLVARDEQGELWLTSAVGTAVPVVRIVAWAVQVLGLEPGGWTLSVGGVEQHPDAVLDGRLEEGGLLELSR